MSPSFQVAWPSPLLPSRCLHHTKSAHLVLFIWFCTPNLGMMGFQAPALCSVAWLWLLEQGGPPGWWLFPRSVLQDAVDTLIVAQVVDLVWTIPTDFCLLVLHYSLKMNALLESGGHSALVQQKQDNHPPSQTFVVWKITSFQQEAMGHALTGSQASCPPWNFSQAPKTLKVGL